MRLPNQKIRIVIAFIFLAMASSFNAQAIETPVCPEMTISKASATNSGKMNLSANLSSGLEYRYYSFSSSNPDTAKRYSQYEKPYRKKSPAMAFVYGFFPGFIVHGSGHYYVGDRKTANKLLGIELVTVSVTLTATYIGLVRALDEKPETSSRTADAVAITGVLVFLTTWVYDFSAAPAKAIELNKKHGYSIQLQPRITGDMASLNMTLTFR
jgi:hypothetical protein